MIEITEADFSIEGVVEKAKSKDVGAIVTFLGTVRNDDIKSMELEAYKEAAIPELERIRDEAVERFHLKSVDIIHRVGSLSVGDNIVLIVCAAGHRKEAFDGCSYIIEELKVRAPIWKKEIKSDGHRWVGIDMTDAWTDFAIVLCTAPPGGSEKIAKVLVEERLAACVNVSVVRSYFFWEGKSCDETEELMIIKTEMKQVERIKARIKELHSYELPEIIIIPIVGGDERYLQWIGQSLG